MQSFRVATVTIHLLCNMLSNPDIHTYCWEDYKSILRVWQLLRYRSRPQGVTLRPTGFSSCTNWYIQKLQIPSRYRGQTSAEMGV